MTEIWVSSLEPVPSKAIAEVLDAEIQAALDEGIPIEDVWVVDPPTKWQIKDEPQ